MDKLDCLVSRVQCHTIRRAESLRRRGKRIWKVTMNIAGSCKVGEKNITPGKKFLIEWNEGTFEYFCSLRYEPFTS